MLEWSCWSLGFPEREYYKCKINFNVRIRTISHVMCCYFGTDTSVNIEGHHIHCPLWTTHIKYPSQNSHKLLSQACGMLPSSCLICLCYGHNPLFWFLALALSYHWFVFLMCAPVQSLVISSACFRFFFPLWIIPFWYFLHMFWTLHWIMAHEGNWDWLQLLRNPDRKVGEIMDGWNKWYIAITFDCNFIVLGFLTASVLW